MPFEGYTVVRPLYASARSHVWLAVDDQSGLQAVLKTPSIDLRDDQDHLDRFCWRNGWHGAYTARMCCGPFANDRPRQHVYVAMGLWTARRWASG